ncbi:sushi, von Willebrand factor type A, EGF and pentraxin domain-containing protein 1-like [Lampetra fluviatilis]
MGAWRVASPTEPPDSRRTWRSLRLPLFAALLVPAAALIVRDEFWEGSSPLCWGHCRDPYRAVQSDPCGDGTCCWVGRKTLCRVNCGPPGHVQNGVAYGNDWWVFSVVRYRCAPGFVMVGAPTRTCLPAGHWSPQPTCARACSSGLLEVDVARLAGGCPPLCPAGAFDAPSAAQLGCSRLSHCTDTRHEWLPWASSPCARCLCRCFVPCGHTGAPPPVQDLLEGEHVEPDY